MATVQVEYANHADEKALQLDGMLLVGVSVHQLAHHGRSELVAWRWNSHVTVANIYRRVMNIPL